MKIILASQSPRRKELLEKAGFSFEIIPSTSKEILNSNINIYEAIENIALNKALDVFNKHPESLVIGADTIVYIGGLVLGKPKDVNDAERMIRLLSGKTHEVITGVGIITNKKKELFHSVSYITFKELSEEEIKNYLKLSNIYDKAGAYAIQGEAGEFVTKLVGDYYNVMGLPIDELKQKLMEFIDE